MTRRNLLAAGAAALTAAAQTSSKQLLKPAALKAGDAVGLITPATYVSDPDALITAERTVKYFGLEPRS
jgi:hypothetical protein